MFARLVLRRSRGRLHLLSSSLADRRGFRRVFLFFDGSCLNIANGRRAIFAHVRGAHLALLVVASINNSKLLPELPEFFIQPVPSGMVDVLVDLVRRLVEGLVVPYPQF